MGDAMVTQVLWSKLQAMKVEEFRVPVGGEIFRVSVFLDVQGGVQMFRCRLRRRWFCWPFTMTRHVPYGGDTNVVTTAGEAAVRAVDLVLSDGQKSKSDK